MRNIVIAIDGPAGAGKSTIARIIADKLKILYIDTGAMYRAVTLEIIRKSIKLEDIDKIRELIDKIEIELKDNKVYLNREDVTEEIRQQQVSNLVSPVSAIKDVRKKLVELQREMASNNSVVMDGRDIGTNVLKSANVKIFLTASVEERAKRRYTEMVNKGYKVELETIKSEIIMRDKIDSSREINPLKKAEDAIVIDTTDKNIENVVEEIICIVKKR